MCSQPHKHNKCDFMENMKQEKFSRDLTFWDHKHEFLLKIQEIEQRCFHQCNHKSMCKRLRAEDAVLALRQRVHDFPTEQVQEMFLPEVGMLLSDFAMHDVLSDLQKK